MAFSQVISVTTSSQVITLEGSARWLEFRPLGVAAATTVTVSTSKSTSGVPVTAVSEANDMQTFALNPAQVVTIPSNGLPSFAIIASAGCKVAVRGVDL